MRLHCFFTVNSSVNAAGDHLADGSVMEKALRFKKTFPQGYVISLCGVVVRCSRVEPNVPGSSVGNSFFPSFFFSSVFCVLVFYKYIPK